MNKKEKYRLEEENQPKTLIGLFCKLIELKREHVLSPAKIHVRDSAQKDSRKVREEG